MAGYCRLERPVCQTGAFGCSIPFLALLGKKIKQGVSVRLLHAKEPGENFRNDFDKYPALWKGLERALCPRIHFKLMIFDLQKVYIGSANLTGAALGMKSENRRNFEAGIFTDEEGLTKAAIDQFDEVGWESLARFVGGKTCVKTG